jgi:hypothetical protein
MGAGARRAALVYVTYLGATSTLQALWSGRIVLSAENLVRWVFVPGVQVAALAAAAAVWRRAAGARQLSGLSAFFVVWVVLTLPLILATIALSVGLFHTIDVTDNAIFSVVAIPALQATVLVSPAGRPGRWMHLCAEVLAHPLTRPILWIDALMLSAGLMLWQNSHIGIARAPIQRHWVGTKLIAAAVFLVGQRPGRAADRRRRDGALAALAVALGAVGLNAFTPWILTSTLWMPDALNRQPLPLLWLEVYGAIFTIVLLLVLSCMPAIARTSPTAARLAGTATIVLFWAMLAVLTNGSASLQPVLPWAPLAVLAASASATLFACAAILSAEVAHRRAD